MDMFCVEECASTPSSPGCVFNSSHNIDIKNVPEKVAGMLVLGRLHDWQLGGRKWAAIAHKLYLRHKCPDGT